MENKKNKLILFLDLLKEFDMHTYQEINENTEIILDLYIGKYWDQPVIIYSGKNSPSLKISYNLSDAYEKISGTKFPTFFEFLKKETLDNYDSLDDYYRVQEAEKKKQKLEYESIIQKHKNKYEQLNSDPLEIIKYQQKEIGDLNKKIDDLNKKIDDLNKKIEKLSNGLNKKNKKIRWW